MTKTLYLEMSASSGGRGDWTRAVETDGVGRIVVGTGPGSFAGVRSALAFAKGFSIGGGCEVLGLPSPCAVAGRFFAENAAAAETVRLAVVGDARCGKLWAALFDGFDMAREPFQTGRENVAAAVAAPAGRVLRVVTPDEPRIGAFLAETFGDAYAGGALPAPEGLRAFAEANPAALRPDPLPIYLNPAVR